LKDYYAVLGLTHDASQKEIKAAFRKKAKQKHPDSGGKDMESIRLVLEAYHVLSDAKGRWEYDKKYKPSSGIKNDTEFNYRQWLLERIEISEYAAKLIFYDLLHGLEDEALVLYQKLFMASSPVKLERFFDRSEAMDAEFCIAEEFAKRQRYKESYEILYKLIMMEKEKPLFGHFFDVVLEQFRLLVIKDMFQVMKKAEMLDILDEALKLHSSKENDALFFKCRAEILLSDGKISEARQAIKSAYTLSPRILSIKKLFTSLNSQYTVSLDAI
jgi:curved DNA-binding protein CbpA